MGGALSIYYTGLNQYSRNVCKRFSGPLLRVPWGHNLTASMGKLFGLIYRHYTGFCPAKKKKKKQATRLIFRTCFPKKKKKTNPVIFHGTDNKSGTRFAHVKILCKRTLIVLRHKFFKD